MTFRIGNGSTFFRRKLSARQKKRNKDLNVRSVDPFYSSSATASNATSALLSRRNFRSNNFFSLFFISAALLRSPSMQLQRKVWGEKDIRRRRRLLLLLLLPLQLLHFSCCTLVVVESEKRGERVGGKVRSRCRRRRRRRQRRQIGLTRNCFSLLLLTRHSHSLLSSSSAKNECRRCWRHSHRLIKQKKYLRFHFRWSKFKFKRREALIRRRDARSPRRLTTFATPMKRRFCLRWLLWTCFKVLASSGSFHFHWSQSIWKRNHWFEFDGSKNAMKGDFFSSRTRLQRNKFVLFQLVFV